MLWLWLAGCGYISASDHELNTRLPVISVTEIAGDFAVCGSTGVVIRATGHPQLEGRELALTIDVADELTLPPIEPAIQTGGVIEWQIGELGELPAPGELVFDMQIDTFGLTLRQTRNVEVAGYPPAFEDGDGDGFGSGPALQACGPLGSVAVDGDCNDLVDTVFPEAPELCDGLDNDCDGEFDEAVDLAMGEAVTVYEDMDGDGFGGASSEQCPDTPGFVEDGTDCDDADPNVNPDAEEQCDGIDWNCTGDAADISTDVAGSLQLHADGDGDGFGSGVVVYSCDAIDGLVEDNTDCDDLDGDVFPGAAEVCDAVDNDCSNAVDDSMALIGGFYFETQRYDTLQDAVDMQANANVPIVVCGDVDFDLLTAPGWTTLSLGVSDVVRMVAPNGTLRGRLQVTGAGEFDLQNAQWVATGSANGAALRLEGTTGRLSEVDFVGPAVTPPARGGCVSIDSADFEMHGGSFSFCRSTGGGGAVEVLGSDPVRFIDVDFTNNDTEGSGGAIIASDDADVDLTDSLLRLNIAEGDGGAVWMQSGHLSTSNTDFELNEADFAAGAVGLTPGATAVIALSGFEGNRSENPMSGSGGGAIWSRSTGLEVMSSTFNGNFAFFDGGAVFIGGGGVLSATGTTSFVGNTASAGTGGGVRAMSGTTVSLVGTALADNLASLGGGVHTEGTLDLTNANLNRNRSTAGSVVARGGALLLGPDGPAVATIDGATFLENSATARGGAIQVESEGDNENYVVGDGAEFLNNDAGDGSALYVEKGLNDVDALAGASLVGGIFTDNGGQNIVGGLRGCVSVLNATISDTTLPDYWARWNGADSLESTVVPTDFACDSVCEVTTEVPSCAGNLF